MMFIAVIVSIIELSTFIINLFKHCSYNIIKLIKQYDIGGKNKNY